jgi:predicted nucleic acid-binding protein
MPVLVDTSVWIDYFRGGNDSKKLDLLIDENLIVTNDLILAELVPFLKVRNQRKIVALLGHMNKLNLMIDWDHIIECQYQCLRKGINGIGVPDLVIAQNALQNRCEIYSLDKHFELMREVLDLQLLS